ncbi:MAG: ribonuclease Z [Candidatus Micrarchaeota archaeon]
MFRLTALGSGSAMPSKEHLTSGFALRIQGGVYLVDCPEGSQRQLMKYGASYAKIKSVFLTHLHADHFLGLLGLIQTFNLIQRQEDLFLFGPRGSKKLFETLLSPPNLMPRFKVKVFEIPAKGGLLLGEKDFEVSAFPVEHGCPGFGFVFEEKEKIRFHEAKAKAAGIKGPLFTEIQNKGKIKIGKKTLKLGDYTYKQKGRKIVFSGDTRPCKTLEHACKDADLIVLDSAFGKEESKEALDKMHSTTTEAAETAKKSGAKKLLLTHLSNRYADRAPLLAEARVVFKETEIAREGLVEEV